MVKAPPKLGRNPHRKQHYERERRALKAWRRWYGLAAWKRRAAEQLRKQPLCERHLKRGEIVAAKVANHKLPHRGDWDLFINGELESACKPCHDSEIQREERAAARLT